jgi:hypothetical protein
MYIDGADDTLCDVAGSWQDTLEDEEAYHDLEYWIEVLGKKNKRPDLVRKMKKRKQSKKRDITLKIKDSLADIFDLIGSKKISEIITEWRSTLTDKKVWIELEKCLQGVFDKKEEYFKKNPDQAYWVNKDGTLTCDNRKILNRFKKHPSQRKRWAKKYISKKRMEYGS